MNFRKTYFVLISPLLVLITIATFLLELEIISQQDLIDLGNWGYLLLFGFPVLYTIIYIVLVNYFTSAFDKDILAMTKYSKKFKANNSRFKSVFLDWRIHTEAAKIDKINGGRLTLKAYERGRYLINIFHSLMSRLKEGDEYLTLSNLTFWANAHYDEFIQENLEAVNRGVLIKRIIVIDGRIFKNEEQKVFQTKLSKFCRRLNEWKSSEATKEAFDKMEFNFYILEEYDSNLLDSLPYAIFRNAKCMHESMIVAPNFQKDRSKIDILFEETKSNPSYNILTGRFNHIASRNDLLSIEDMISRLNSPD